LEELVKVDSDLNKVEDPQVPEDSAAEEEERLEVVEPLSKGDDE
jgi:hypothetical protein